MIRVRIGSLAAGNYGPSVSAFFTPANPIGTFTTTGTAPVPGNAVDVA